MFIFVAISITNDMIYTELLMKATLLKAINDLIEYNPVAFVLALAFLIVVFYFWFFFIIGIIRSIFKGD